MNLDNINQDLFNDLFKNYAEKVQVILRTSKIKGDNYDKFRNVGYDKSFQNPLFIKAIKRTISSNSLIIRELGLLESGAIQIIIRENDVSLLKTSDKLIIDNIEYTAWNKALGNRIQIYKLPFKYSKVVLFRLNK
jgi:hypothetical protein